MDRDDVERLAHLALALLFACATDLPEPTDLAMAAHAETERAWAAFGLPDVDPSCNVDALAIEEHVDPLAFTEQCWRRPICANACLDWGYAGRELNTERYPIAVISPLARNGSVPSLAVHELLHAMLQCSGEDDPLHERDEIWHGVESEAKAAFYGGE